MHSLQTQISSSHLLCCCPQYRCSPRNPRPGQFTLSHIRIDALSERLLHPTQWTVPDQSDLTSPSGSLSSELLLTATLAAQDLSTGISLPMKRC